MYKRQVHKFKKCKKHYYNNSSKKVCKVRRCKSLAKVKDRCEECHQKYKDFGIEDYSLSYEELKILGN